MRLDRDVEVAGGVEVAVDPEPLERQPAFASKFSSPSRSSAGISSRKPGQAVVDPVGEEGEKKPPLRPLAASASSPPSSTITSRPGSRSLRQQRRPEPAEPGADDREVGLGGAFERRPGGGRSGESSQNGVGRRRRRRRAVSASEGSPSRPTDRARPGSSRRYPAAPMDLFVAACQGVGLAVAAGALAGAAGRRDGIGTVLLVARGGRRRDPVRRLARGGGPPGLARVAGRGALIAAGSFCVVSDFAAGAAARAEGGGFIAALIALAALAIAGLSVSVRPLGLVALAGDRLPRPRPPPPRGAQVRGPADAAVSRAASSSSASSTRCAPTSSTRPRPRAARADLRRPARARHADRRLRLLLPLGDPGLHLGDHHRRTAPTATGSAA